MEGRDKQTVVSHKTKQRSDKFEISKMFNINNLKDILRTVTKVRPNNGRLKIWLLYLSMCVLMLTDAKFFSILFPYTEKVYEWDAKKFSDIKSLASIMQTISLPVASAILSTYLQLRDSKLGIIGLILISLEDICIGSIMNPLGLYLLFIIGSPSTLSSLSIRSLLSKIAEESESGKIFALLGALELIFSSLETVVLNTIFQLSIDVFPSLLFQMAVALNFIPIFIFFWIDLTPKESQKQTKL